MAGVSANRAGRVFHGLLVYVAFFLFNKWLRDVRLGGVCAVGVVVQVIID